MKEQVIKGVQIRKNKWKGNRCEDKVTSGDRREIQPRRIKKKVEGKKKDATKKRKMWKEKKIKKKVKKTKKKKSR